MLCMCGVPGCLWSFGIAAQITGTLRAHRSSACVCSGAQVHLSPCCTERNRRQVAVVLHLNRFMMGVQEETYLF